MDYGLIPISPLTLTSDIPLGVDIYLCIPSKPQPVLFVAKEETISETALSKLQRSLELRLYIDRDDREQYLLYLRANIDEFILDDRHAPIAQAVAMSEMVRGILDDAFASNNMDATVASSNDIGARVAKLISNVSINPAALCSVMHHDFGTFTHSANVGFYVGLLAHEVGFRGEQLQEIISGGLLHDVGKLEIDTRILNKPARLDEFEFRMIQTHSAIGFRKLCHCDGVTELQALMAYQHHERIDGKGYPVGLVADEIEVASKLCSVVDVFEALTSNRPYRKAMRREIAVELMEKDVGESFEPEYFKCWKSLVERAIKN